MLRELLFIREHRINYDTHFLHSGEKRIYVFVATEEREIFEFCFVHLAINNHLWPDDIQTQPQLYQSTGHLAHTDLIFVCKEVFIMVLICVAASDEVVFNYEVDNSAVLSHVSLLVITQADIARFVGVDCVDNHIVRGGQGGIFVTHEPSQECLHLIEGQEAQLQEDVNWIHEISQPNVFPGNSS